MRLSLLQKFILRSVYESRIKQYPRTKLLQFYEGRERPVDDEAVNAITKSVERLIDRELMIGYGVRTPHKWYMHEVKLTAKGRREAKRLRGEQQKLPLKTPNTKMQ